MKRKRRLLVYVGVAIPAVVIGLVGALALEGGKPGPSSQSPMRPGAPVVSGASLTVNLISPATVTWPDTLTTNGPITAWQEAVVSAEIGGVRIAEVLADVGDQVRSGDLLVRFDEANAKAALAQQQASVAEMKARLAEATANAERARRLRENLAINEQDLIRALTGAEAAKAQLDLAEARLASQKLNLADTRVLAPDDGVISSRNALLGAVVAPGMELFRLVRQNRLEWRAELTATQLALLKIGERAELELPDGSIATGTVRQIAPVLDERTRIGMAYVAIDPNTSSAKPGMYAKGRILLGDRQGLALPSSALVVRDGREYVFVVSDEGIATETKVAVGRRRGGDVEIIEGIGPDARVVASGGAFLNDGDRVRVVPWSGNTDGAAPGGAR